MAARRRSATATSRHDFRLGSATEPLQRQALVAELAVEAFRRAILPGHPGIDQRRPHALPDDSLEQRAADELGAVVGSQVRRCAALRDEPRQHLDDAIEIAEKIDIWSADPIPLTADTVAALLASPIAVISMAALGIERWAARS